ncbi:MAG: YqaJ viral recombinase family protein [Spirochaetia bacterium]|jgi:putative phage-type endonuclease|nr:YqaJ viral recombinase family protein [Spirochaetia bacterium]
MEQYSNAWWEARNGKVTASPILGICKGVKGKYLASRKNYMAEKIIEILTGSRPEGFTSSSMQWGTDTEPMARAVYEAETGNIVKEVGFINHPTIDRLGASPDGVIELGNKNLEIKCPNTATHIEFVLNPVIKREYIYQMNCQMMCTGAEVCHFVSYDPRLPDNLAYKMIEIKRDPIICKEIEEETKLFLMELDATIRALKAVA